MTDTLAPDTAAARHSRPPARLHPLALRIMHWLNALAILVLILSGWAIYNDEVIFGWLHFPGWMTLGDGPEGALQWHFLAMWILGLNGIAYLVYGFATGRFRRLLLPIRIGEVIAGIRAALALRLNHHELTRYNAVQRALYIGVILVGIVQVLSGLVVWKPVQFSECAILFGSFQSARLVHFLGMAAIVAFVLVHVTLALLVPRTLVAMLTGGPQLVPDLPANPEAMQTNDRIMPGDMPADPEPMEAGSPMQPGCSKDDPMGDQMGDPMTDPQAAQSRHPRQPAS